MDERLFEYDAFDPAEEGLREALTSTGNGYFCARGTAEWEDAGDVHYPGTYAHGLYNRETTIMGGRPVLNEDLVNLPNWLVLKLKIEGEDAIRLGNVELLSYRHAYDIGTAMVIRELRFRDRSRARDIAAQPALREHGALPPGGDRVDDHGRELVRQRRARVGDRRARHERRRRPLPDARGTSPRPDLAAHVRARGDRAEGRDAPVEPLRRAGRAHARLPRLRAARRRALAVPDGRLHPAGPALRRRAGRRAARREARLLLHLARPRDQRAARQRRQVGRALSGLRRGAAASHARVG